MTKLTLSSQMVILNPTIQNSKVQPSSMSKTIQRHINNKLNAAKTKFNYYKLNLKNTKVFITIKEGLHEYE